ncbi:peroxisomal targeting signal 1 receptor [Schistocerca nitens]|uniref:peroxisomal targeting signal 1 receptor n=1 Tax=Schistocerca nitens TaxID=7011 RepID=UPI002117C72D|nr:peroxisomal targeting signal 1 receptor [Schistocerca nitens]XP_049806604.1 peroxisomal targeting signal 1 receptor [Schistocerca nitens]
MSLKDLVEADCSREAAAAEFSSHFVHDKAFRDAGVEHPFQDAGGNISSAEQLVNQFLAESAAHSAPKSFRMDSLLEEMREIESSVSHHAPIQAPGVAVLAAADPVGIAGEDVIWAEEFLASEKQLAADDPVGVPGEDLIWAEQYLESGKQFDQEPDGEAIWSSTIETLDKILPVNANRNAEEYELGFGPNWIDEFFNEYDLNIYDPTFKLHATSDELKETAGELIKSVNGTSLETSKFMEFMQQVSDGDIVFPPASTADDESKEITSKDLVDKWTAEFMQEFGGEGGDLQLQFTDFGRSVNAQALWNKMTEQWDSLEATSSVAKERNSEQDTEQLYKFDEENPVSGCEDPLVKGKERLAAGDLIGAILYFEAACQQDEKNAEAWLLLGNSQALNEQDPAAIICLMQTLKLDPYNINALKALAISLTNENYPNHACYILERWLFANPKYKDLIADQGQALEGNAQSEETERMMADVLSKAGLRSSFLKSNYFEKVKNLFIEAARRYPTDVDADVQACLGILFNLSQETDKAVDCFRAALQVRQDDFQLWNSYGATLANGGRSEEAVHAYRRALELYPAFVRARYNVGITCCTLRAYREAAQHFLVSLNQQASISQQQNYRGGSGTIMSDNIWNSLRTVLTLMDDKELLKSVEQRDLEKLSKAFEVE